MHTNTGKDLKTKVILTYSKQSNSFSEAVSKHSCWTDFAYFWLDSIATQYNNIKEVVNNNK